MNVLVVDDDFAIRESLDRALRANGYDVALATDGTKALQAIDDTPFDAVVLDVLMPGRNGIDVCRSLRAAGNRVPILILTARDTVRERVAGLEAGADDYLVKPFALEELIARLRALVRRTTADSQIRRPLARSPVARGATRYTKDRTAANAAPPARVVHAQSPPGPSARARVRAGLGLRLRRHLELS